jgi:NAD(P)-dependent dehydrogenase (short-subunit alcohol dehydrogenase family)
MSAVHALFDVAGRVALVTGSSRGIGRALAGGLAAAGATVVLNGRDPDAVDATRAALAAETGGTVHAAAFDVTDSAAITAAVDRIEDTVGPIPILVNNAGVQNRTPISRSPTTNGTASSTPTWARRSGSAAKWPAGCSRAAEARSSTSARCRVTPPGRAPRCTPPPRVG